MCLLFAKHLGIGSNLCDTGIIGSNLSYCLKNLENNLLGITWVVVCFVKCFELLPLKNKH